jgi:hypothetical protein
LAGTIRAINGLFGKLGVGLSLLLFVGFSSLPVSVLLGLVKLPEGVTL